MIANHGEATYPGIMAYESVEFCDCSGIQPAIGTIKVFPQYGIPEENGDLVLTYNGNTIRFRDCHIDSLLYEAGSGGQIVSVRLLDERWTWANAGITGRYNFRLPNNWINPDHEKTPQELAALCFRALGVVTFDVSALPNDARPEADWDHANPAQELDKICNELGCRIVPVRSVGGWAVVVTGEGRDLPNYPAESVGQGIDPQEVPDFIKIVTGPIRYQLQLPLAPIGRDIDLSYKPLDQLSYAPDVDAPSGGFGAEWNEMRNIDGTRVRLPDGTAISPQELARESVFRIWRIEFQDQPGAEIQSNGERAFPVATLPYLVTRKQMILSKELVQTFTDYLGAQHRRQSYVSGKFFGKLCEGFLGNYPNGTRIDKQSPKSDTNSDERASFSLSLDPEDTDRSMLILSEPMVQQMAPVTVHAIAYSWKEAELKFTTAIQVRDPDTWQPNRYEFLMQIGSGSNKDFAVQMIRDDIQPWVITQYYRGRPSGYTSNYQEVVDQCRYYAEALARKYQTVTSETRNLIGLYPIDMDGAIQQVTYSINRGGASTMASRGTEHSWYTPEYEERRQQVARQGIAEKLQYVKYEVARRNALLGTSST